VKTKVKPEPFIAPIHFITKRFIKKILGLYLIEGMTLQDISYWQDVPIEQIEEILDNTLPYF
jgi:hypothetical protein